MITRPYNVDKYIVFTEPNEYNTSYYKCCFGKGCIIHSPGEAYTAVGCLKTSGRFETFEEVKSAVEKAFVAKLIERLDELRKLTHIYKDIYNYY